MTTRVTTASINTDDDALDEASTKEEMETSTEETGSEMFHTDGAAKVVDGMNAQLMVLTHVPALLRTLLLSLFLTQFIIKVRHGSHRDEAHCNG